jgi:hypothetical protein
MLKRIVMNRQEQPPTRTTLDEIGYLVLGILMILVGARGLITGQLASPLWSISGWQAGTSGVLCLLLGGVLVIHSLRKRARRTRAHNDCPETKRI